MTNRDHSDENLISPQHYREFCIPYYRKITELLHAGGKLVSTHLDGNFKGYMPYLHETGFDILDGCTPAPMTNWTPANSPQLRNPQIWPAGAACRQPCSAKM